MKNNIAALLGICTLCGLAALRVSAADFTLTKVEAAPQNLMQIPTRPVGRVNEISDAGGIDYQQQWPGVYFEADFSGQQVFFKLGENHMNLHVTVDQHAPETLTTPSPGLYVIKGLKKKPHQVRIEVITESQSNLNNFGGFYISPTAESIAKKATATGGKPTHQIEFIGDSHTVGYGNVSPKRECTTDEVWATTDTSQAYGPLVARHCKADYQINAISGRGIVRNYGGFQADTLPQVYPYILFDKAKPFNDPQWHPDVIVISLGTNDFSTPLTPNEKWKTREQLHEDYEATYVKFVQELRKRNPTARFILWATDGANGEIIAEVTKVVAKLKAMGEHKVTFVPVIGLTFTGCHWHPSVKDDQTIAGKLIKKMDSSVKAW